MFFDKFICLVLLLAFIDISHCTKYRLLISDNGPVIVGAEITFKAEIFTENGKRPYSSYTYIWSDNADPPNIYKVRTDTPTSTWSVSYPRSTYKEGTYEVYVTVEDWYVVWYPIISNSSHFVLTNNLHGDIGVRQNGQSRPNYYVAVNQTVVHEISLSHPDFAYIEANATSILTYWFVDCAYLGSSTDYSLEFTYPKTNMEHVVEALIIASYDPLPPEPTTLTPTTVPPTTTTPKNQSDPVHYQAKRSIKKDTADVVDYIDHLKSTYSSLGMKAQIQALINEVKHLPNAPVSTSCINESVIPYVSNFTYGYFRRKINVADPVSNVVVAGNNWLQHGDMMLLQISCSGLAPFQYCTQYWRGHYNSTGNETCIVPIQAETCAFPVVHYFPYPGINTMLLIVSNDVGTNISTFVVNVYNVKRQPQLSVIVVPVSFSIIAVVLIIFGVAYYLQSRSRYTIEVADFDFGEQVADLEYKTFTERLRESFNNALRWGTAMDPDEADAQGSTSQRAWPRPDKNRYGTMT